MMMMEYQISNSHQQQKSVRFGLLPLLSSSFPILWASDCPDSSFTLPSSLYGNLLACVEHLLCTPWFPQRGRGIGESKMHNQKSKGLTLPSPTFWNAPNSTWASKSGLILAKTSLNKLLAMVNVSKKEEQS